MTWQHDPGTVGDWFINGNWDLGLPTAATDVGINNGGSAQIAAALARGNTVVVGDSAGQSGTLILTSGSLLATERIFR
jgi:hypothetical protein